MFNLFTNSKTRYNKNFNKLWTERNSDYSEVLLEAIEMDCISLGEYILIEENKTLVEKLTRIGFELFTDEYPEKEMFATFSSVYYNEKYNIWFNLYQPAMKKVIMLAYDIAFDTEFSGQEELQVFFSAVRNCNGIIK